MIFFQHWPDNLKLWNMYSSQSFVPRNGYGFKSFKKGKIISTSNITQFAHQWMHRNAKHGSFSLFFKSKRVSLFDCNLWRINGERTPLPRNGRLLRIEAAITLPSLSERSSSRTSLNYSLHPTFNKTDRLIG